MPPNPSVNFPQPAKELQGVADDLISAGAGDELEKLIQTAERDGELPLTEAAVTAAQTGDASPAGALDTSAATGDPEGEAIEAVLDDAGKVKESELDELFAELTKDDVPQPAAPETVVATGDAQTAESVGPLLSPAAPVPAPTGQHVGPPFLSAASEWKPVQASVNVLNALPDVESPPGMNWLFRVLIAINRPFEFLPPDARRNLGYIACLVLASALAVSGYAFLKR